MQQEIDTPAFDKALMTGVFVGIITTVVLLFFHVIFLQSTGFPYSTIINVSTLIFSVNIFFLLVGPLYYWLNRISKYGTVIFVIIFVLITAFLVMKASGVQRTDDHQLNVEFRELLSAIIIIIGLAAAFLVPFLFHNKGFRKNVI